MAYRKAKLHVSILNILVAMLLLFFIHPVLADYNYDGSPEPDELIMTEHGTVIGGVYVAGGRESGLGNTPYTQSFNVPEGTIKWAKLYVGVWGGTDERIGTIDVTFNDIELETLTLEGKGDTNPDVYCSGYGVYWIGYNVTSNTTSGPLDAVVTTNGDIDGRIYGIVLVAVYNDPDGEEVEYWINEGNPNLYETNDEAVAEFPGTIELDKFTLGRLTAVYLAGGYGTNDYLHFNDETLCDGDNCDDIANSKNYFDIKTFDVIDYLAEDENKATFDRGDEEHIHPVLAVLTLHTQEEGDSDLTVSNVSLSVTIIPAISLVVTPGTLDFGSLSIGETSNVNNLTLNNQGGYDINVTADVEDTANDLFVEGILLDSASWNNYDIFMTAHTSTISNVVLKVPNNYVGVGTKQGALVFWAQQS